MNALFVIEEKTFEWKAELKERKSNSMNTTHSMLPRVFPLQNARSGNSKAAWSDAIEIPDLALIYYCNHKTNWAKRRCIR
jgi:hypothetical protein